MSTAGAVENAARTIDLNADMGESYGRWVLGDDAGVMQFVSTVNIAIAELCDWERATSRRDLAFHKSPSSPTAAWNASGWI